MWTNSIPIEDGFYWFKGKIKRHSNDWNEVSEIVVRILAGGIYCPGSNARTPLSETIGLWKEVNEKAYVRTKEALGVAESLLQVAFDKFEEVTGFIITDVEVTTHSNGIEGIDRNMITNISFGKGPIHIGTKKEE